MRERASRVVERLGVVNALGGWRFTEGLHGKTFALSGMAGQSWNAAAFLMARDAITRQRPLFGVWSRRRQPRQPPSPPPTNLR
jgi:hypothetical protein